MDQYNYHIEKIRFHIQEENTLLVRGWFRQDNPQKRIPAFYLDSEKLEYELNIKKGVNVRQRYRMYQADVSQEVLCTLKLPDNWKSCGELRITTVQGTTNHDVAKISVSELVALRENLDYNIDSEALVNGKIKITGWVMGKDPVEIQVLDGRDSIENAKITFSYRRDVMEVYEESRKDYDAGFSIEMPVPQNKKITILFKSGGKTTLYEATVKAICHQNTINQNVLQKFITHWKREGLIATLARAKRKLLKQQNYISYEKWQSKHQIGEKELERQRGEVFPYMPKISIVVPLYHTPKEYLHAMIRSVQEQSYGNWELCLSDGSGQGPVDTAEETPGVKKDVFPVAKELERYRQERRIRVVYSKRPLDIALNTNAAIEIASGEFIAFMDHDDVLAPNALYECVKALNEKPGTEFIYSDEDKVSMDGKRYFEPHFKSDFNLDLLRSTNYICHLVLVKKELCDKAGRLREGYNGAQDYDFVLRCIEQTENIYHIPKILYHWRMHENSTAANPQSKTYAFEAGVRALESHLERCNINATVQQTEFLGMYRVKYRLEEEPLVSVIIPNKDSAEDLKKCLDSLEQRSEYRNLEYIIVENNSQSPEIFRYYEELERENPRARVYHYEGSFNYAKINNFGVSKAKGEYLLLLNNDTELKEPDSIREMLSICMRREVGIVGAKLLYFDNTVQHAGVIVGAGGVAGHCFVGLGEEEAGYFARAVCIQDYNAVTAACLMTKRSVFEQVQGLREEFEVAFNDIDFCMKVRKQGLLVVYTPYAKFYHYESKSRGADTTPEKAERFMREIQLFEKLWPEIYHEGDNYYNPNLSYERADFYLNP